MLSTAVMPDARMVKIQTSKTYKHVELDEVREEVKRSVLAAALGSDDPCKARNNIGGEKGAASDKVGGYYWTVTDNTFCAKSSSDATECAFEIRFEGEEPAVWVEDAEEWKEKTCSDISNYVTERGIDSYSNYNITLSMNGSECISDYGKAKYEKRMEQLTNPLNPAYLAWGFSCMGTTLACAGVVGFLTAGMTAWQAVTDVAKGSLACWAGPALAAASNYISLKLFPTEQPGIARTVPVLGIASATGVDYIRYTRATSRILELERAMGTGGKILEGTTGILETLESTSGKSIVVGTTSVGPKSLEKISELTGNLSKIQKILELGGQGDAAEVIGKSLEQISNTCYQGGDPKRCKAAIDMALQEIRKQEGAIKAAAEEVQKEYKELEKRSSKLSMCSTIGQITGAVVGATTFLATYVPVDTLKVDIYDVGNICTIRAGMGYILVSSGNISQQIQNVQNPNIKAG
ncbi:hypothetical protein [Thermococcus sp.]|uniref:hypothetical protein n=1 Tax=Thermococcus sp. TaxID=35749 RepID=UPI0026222920|nr:hypothetical protein [Thermococcus sp.]